MHQGLVLDCTPEALQEGVRIGMRRATAAGMSTRIVFIQHDPGLSQSRLEALAMSLLQYTPELALFGPDSLILNVSASLSLFKGPLNLYRRIRKSLNKAGAPEARISMAPSAAGAWLMARQTQTRRRRILSMHLLKHRLDNLPVSDLPPAKPYIDWLHTIGCTTLRHLVQLPRAGLNLRTSILVGQHLDAAYGDHALSLSWYQPPQIFYAICPLAFHTAHTHALLTAGQYLVEQLCGWLQARHLSAFALQFSFHYEKGRHARPPSCIVLRLSVPSHHSKDFLVLLSEHLDRTTLHAPVIAVELHHVQSQNQNEQSGDLFPDYSHYQRRESELIDVLQARLGKHAILKPDWTPHYLPEYANHWKTVGQLSSGGAGGHASQSHKIPSKIHSEIPSHRPFWIFENPIQLSTQHDRPYYQGRPLRLLHGPERIESGWWMMGRHEQRDYFIAHDHSHCWYWIYRQRGVSDPHWFLHGLFG